MKDKKPFFIQIVVGVALIVAGLLTRFGYYSTMLFAIGCGLASGSIVQIVRIIYWQSPKRQAEYEEKKQQEHISSVDERQEYLRMKAGYMAYRIMTFALLAVAFTLAVFCAEAWVIGMVFSLFIIQWVIGTVVYRILERRI